MREVADVIQGERSFRAETEPSPGKNAAVNGHGDVGSDGHFENHAVAAAVFGHIGDAVRDGFAR